jgi:hypothetical protein
VEERLVRCVLYNVHSRGIPQRCANKHVERRGGMFFRIFIRDTLYHDSDCIGCVLLKYYFVFYLITSVVLQCRVIT